MTFKEYVAQARIGADGPGDVHRLARGDPSLPDIATFRDLQAYLHGKGFGGSLAEHAPKAWARYVEAHNKRRSEIDD